jgi:hypothetical protein
LSPRLERPKRLSAPFSRDKATRSYGAMIDFLNSASPVRFCPFDALFKPF